MFSNIVFHICIQNPDVKDLSSKTIFPDSSRFRFCNVQDGGLVNLGPDRMCDSLDDSDQDEDDEENGETGQWMTPVLDSWDAWGADGGQVTTRAVFLY